MKRKATVMQLARRYVLRSDLRPGVHPYDRRVQAYAAGYRAAKRKP